MFFFAYAFKGQVHVFAGRVKIVCHPSCRASAILKYFCPLPIAQSVVSLTAESGVVSLILARYHTFLEIVHEIISMFILFPPLIQEGLFSVTRESTCTKYWLTAL